MKDIVVVGEINPDLLASGLETLPRLGTEVLCKSFDISLGGSSALAAAGMARLGLNVGFISKVGDDLFGRWVLEEIARAGVDVSHVVIDPDARTGVGVILSLPSDRGIVTFLGTIAMLSAQDIDMDYVQGFRHLHVSSFFLQKALQPFVPELFKLARQFGLTTSLDTGWDPEERWDAVLEDALCEADVFLPNELEAMAIARTQDPYDALDVLHEKTGGTVAVKLGDKGAVARRGEQTARHPGFRVPVVDTTGAGDCFDAGFLYGWVKGWPIDRCLALGCACGALSVSAPGGSAAQPTLDEALHLLNHG
ncbi:MAG: carbohydrate kinase family protein [Armatimonadota bacterium]